MGGGGEAIVRCIFRDVLMLNFDGGSKVEGGTVGCILGDITLCFILLFTTVILSFPPTLLGVKWEPQRVFQVTAKMRFFP